MAPQPLRIGDDVLRRIQGEFNEMPGLRLTPPQACRLWGMDSANCAATLDALVATQFLFRTRDGSFMRVERATPERAKLRNRADTAVA
jgi:hypothetical protein